jgi:hypothetical protein
VAAIQAPAVEVVSCDGGGLVQMVDGGAGPGSGSMQTAGGGTVPGRWPAAAARGGDAGRCTVEMAWRRWLKMEVEGEGNGKGEEGKESGAVF